VLTASPARPVPASWLLSIVHGVSVRSFSRGGVRGRGRCSCAALFRALENKMLAVHRKCGLRCTMPAINPRITITLEPSTAAQLRRMSALTGNSQSSMISELLAQSSPVFDRLIAVLEAAEVAKTAAREDAAEKLKAAQSKIENQLGLMLDWMDDSSRPLLEHAEKVKRRTRRQAQEQPGTGDRATGGACAPTPLSNRGVRSDPQTRKTQGKSRAYKDLLSKSEHAQKTTQKRTKKGAV
jgi:hypothetical protein